MSFRTLTRLLPLALLGLSAACATQREIPLAPLAAEAPTPPKPTRYFFEAEDGAPGVEAKIHHTGISVGIGEGERDARTLSWSLDDVPAGRYAVWALVGVRSYDADATEGVLDIQQGNQRLPLTVPHLRALRWERAEGFLELVGATGDDSRMTLSQNSGSTRPVVDVVMLVSAASDYVPEGRELEYAAKLPPVWAFGVLYGGYTDQTRSAARVDSLLDLGFPVAGYWVDSWFWNFTDEGKGPKGYLDFRGDRAAFPDVARTWQDWERKGVKAGIWVWDTVLEDGNEATFEDFKSRGFFDTIALNTNGWHNAPKNTMEGEVDFESPAATAYWQQRLDTFFAAGLDFLKLDRSADTAYLAAAYDATARLARAPLPNAAPAGARRRGFITSHIHNVDQAAIGRYPAKWTGDAKIAWQQPDYPNFNGYSMGAYRENVAMLADSRLAMYGAPFLAHDLGGYSYFGSTEQSPELYTRWAQFAAFTPLVTAFSASSNASGNMPFNYGDAALRTSRHYLRLHAELLPHFYSLAHGTWARGEKVIRDDGLAGDDQFMVGEELLVAPVLEPGATSRAVALPAGEWFEFETGRPVAGSGRVTVAAPLDRVPVLAKAGAIVPVKPFAPNVQSASWDSLRLIVFPGADGGYTLVEDDGQTEAYLEGAFAKTRIRSATSGESLRLRVEGREGSFGGSPPTRHLTVELRGVPTALASAKLNGRPLSLGTATATPEAGQVVELGRVDVGVAQDLVLTWSR